MLHQILSISLGGGKNSNSKKQICASKYLRLSKHPPFNKPRLVKLKNFLWQLPFSHSVISHKGGPKLSGIMHWEKWSCNVLNNQSDLTKWI